MGVPPSWLFGDAREELDRWELYKQTGGDGFAASFPALTDVLKARLSRPARQGGLVKIGAAGWLSVA
jgi:hypothetical protein